MNVSVVSAVKICIIYLSLFLALLCVMYKHVYGFYSFAPYYRSPCRQALNLQLIAILYVKFALSGRRFMGIRRHMIRRSNMYQHVLFVIMSLILHIVDHTLPLASYLSAFSCFVRCLASVHK